MRSIKTLFILAALAALPGTMFAKAKKPAGTPVSWKDVPPAVQTTIQSSAAGGKVAGVEKATSNGALFYLAEVKDSDHKWSKVYVADTGALIKVEPDKARNKRKHKPLFGD
jgi:hypothetical protein